MNSNVRCFFFMNKFSFRLKKLIVYVVNLLISNIFTVLSKCEFMKHYLIKFDLK